MGTPKALLPLKDETFASRLVRVLGVVAQPIILTTGAHPEISAPGAQIIHNPDWREGQLTSLQAGFRALGSEIPAAFFCPVDCPLFTEQTVLLLWEKFQETNALFVIPRKKDKRGHPVLASRKMIDEICALPPFGKARDVVHAYVNQTVYVDVEDEGIFADIDTPEDYEALRRHA